MKKIEKKDYDFKVIKYKKKLTTSKWYNKKNIYDFEVVNKKKLKS